MSTWESTYDFDPDDPYDEFEPVKPAPHYRMAKSRTKAFESIQSTNGLTTVIRLESGELHTVEGRAEIIGTYDPSITLKQFRSDTDEN